MIHIGRFILAFIGGTACALLIVIVISGQQNSPRLDEIIDLVGLIALFAFAPALLATLIFGRKHKRAGTIGMVIFGALTPLFALITMGISSGGGIGYVFNSMTIQLVILFAPVGAMSALVHALIWFNVKPKRRKTS